MLGREFLQRPDADELTLVSRGPEGHRRVAQSVDRKHVAGVGWRGRPHLLEMESEQRLYVLAVEVTRLEGKGHRKRPYFDRKAQEA